MRNCGQKLCASRKLLCCQELATEGFLSVSRWVILSHVEGFEGSWSPLTFPMETPVPTRAGPRKVHWADADMWDLASTGVPWGISLLQPEFVMQPQWSEEEPFYPHLPLSYENGLLQSALCWIYLDFIGKASCAAEQCQLVALIDSKYLCPHSELLNKNNKNPPSPTNKKFTWVTGKWCFPL